MELYQITANQREMQRKLDVLHFIACQGIDECTMFDTSMSADFMAIADKIDAMQTRLQGADRCAECDCANGGDDCNWIVIKKG
jgi:hypothetical protein